MTVPAVNESFRCDLAIHLAQGRREAVLRRRVRGRSTSSAVDTSVGVASSSKWGDQGPVFLSRRRRRFEELGTLPTRALSAETVGAFGPMCFTGVFVGLYATGHGRRSSIHRTSTGSSTCRSMRLRGNRCLPMIAAGSAHPSAAPDVRPLMNSLWRARKSRAGGSIATAVPAR